ncbi:MAG: response regulator [Bacteroidetes bacterium]|nr:response regulator [Bacteroidota bacterium]
MESKVRKVLIVDDEPDIRELLHYNLVADGYEVTLAKDGDEALDKAKKNIPDLILLDVMMPKKSGVELCHLLRSQQQFNNTLIVMLTALNDDGSVIKGLETGADDYIGKPISPKVLLSRLQALFRRQHNTSKSPLEIGTIRIDPEKYSVTVQGNAITLAKKEFELLFLLAQKPDCVFVRNEILSQIWGNEVIVGDRTIDVHIRKIRQKLGVDCIKTIKGVGYKFSL